MKLNSTVYCQFSFFHFYKLYMNIYLFIYLLKLLFLFLKFNIEILPLSQRVWNNSAGSRDVVHRGWVWLSSSGSSGSSLRLPLSGPQAPVNTVNIFPRLVSNIILGYGCLHLLDLLDLGLNPDYLNPPWSTLRELKDSGDLSVPNHCSR